MVNAENARSGCSCGSGCGEVGAGNGATKKIIVIDFLFLDLSVCTRCQGTDGSLDDALREVSSVLKATGVEPIVRKINVTSEALAIKHRFASSPTIRVNGRDIQMEVRESLCESCGDLCGDSVDCRVWSYGGVEYDVPPKAMIVDSILREVYSPSADAPTAKPYIVPDNLKRFFSAKENKAK